MPNPITEWGVKYEDVAIMFYEELYKVKILDLDFVFSNELIFKDGLLDGVKINVDSDKAKSARIKIEEWKEKQDEIVVIVDGANDIKLFDISGLGIAFRAQDIVKDLATTTLDEKDLTKIT